MEAPFRSQRILTQLGRPDSAPFANNPRRGRAIIVIESETDDLPSERYTRFGFATRCKRKRQIFRVLRHLEKVELLEACKRVARLDCC
jgi:hypothetical protein